MSDSLASSADTQLAPGTVGAVASARPTFPRSKVSPIAAQRFAIQATISQGTHDKLRRFQALLGHQVGPGDLAAVLDRALDAGIRELERRKCAAASRPRRTPNPASTNP